jgi:leader peptidase (prepilin peptidase) / N-methyltransferase
MILLLLVLLGLSFGSFVNAFVWRLHEGRDWVRERSECPHCHHILAAKDLVPVLSWLYLRGKCRYCHTRIPDSPIVELTLPLLFVVSYLWWPQPLHGASLFNFVLWLVFLLGFTILALYDLRWFLLPDPVVFLLMGLAALQVIVDTVWTRELGAGALALAAAVIISGLFWLLHKISKGKWIGYGDVKLAIPLGLLAGTPLKAFLLLFAASTIGMVIALPMIMRGKATGKTKLPFGPLLIAGTILVVLFGARAIDWYLSLLPA